MRDHFNDPLLNLRKAKDKKNNADCIAGNGYTTDKFKEEGNAVFDKFISLTEEKQLELIKMKGGNND